MAKDNVTPLPKIPNERHTWKCDVKGCKMKGKAASKDDANIAEVMHKLMAH